MMFCGVISLCMLFLLCIPLMNQPLSLGFLLMISTFSLCICCSMLISSWYSYILFLIYIGALMVMFMYVAVLMPNMIFFSKWAFLFSLLIYFMFYLFTYSYNMKNFSVLINNLDYSFYNESYFCSMEFMSSFFCCTLVGLAIFLFICMIAVVKVCVYKGGPLRRFYYA